MKKTNLNKSKTAIFEKLKESAISVMPIVVIVALLCLFIVPVSTDLLLCFVIGTVLIVAGMALFSVGADVAMTPIGNKIGTAMTKTKRLWLILLVSFLLGFAVTVAEPDLQVLAQTVPHIKNAVLLIAVGVGVGFFLAVCMLRMLTGTKLRILLIVFYIAVFTLAIFSDADFLGVAFDSGGVTTGPMTVPFILALGIGVSNIRSDKEAGSDSFGLVALCSIGPVLAVLILGFFYSGSSSLSIAGSTSFATTKQIGAAYIRAIPEYLKETALALLPVVAIFLLFQIFSLKLSTRNLVKIFFGIVHTYIGLVLFLTGVNVGFSALGSVLGKALALSRAKLLTIPLCASLGWFIISAEPAVLILEKQIEEVSAGAISGRTIKLSLSVAIALATALSMLRVLTGISVMWFLVPGYAISLLLSFFVPDIFTAIAFDSGGVASGPMTATFMLQFMMGASAALGGNILHDAFGVVAMVAMMPLICIQAVGLVYSITEKKAAAGIKEEYGDYDIVELWEADAA